MKAIAAIVHDGENGETYDPRNPEEFCEKLNSLLSERAHRVRQGIEGRRVVRKVFDKRVVAEDLYLGLIRLLSARKQTD